MRVYTNIFHTEAKIYKYGNEAGFEQDKLIANKLNDAINRGGIQGMDAFNQIFGNLSKK